QNGEEHRALQRKIMPARIGEVFDDLPAAGLLPQALKDERRPNAPRRTRCDTARGDGVDDNRLGGEARARTQQALQLPARLQILDAAERGDDLLAHRGAFATAFNDLEIGAAGGGLLAEIHGAEPWERLMRGPHIISKKHRASQTKSKTTWHYIFAKSTPRSNNINDLPPVSGSQVLKISQAALAPWARIEHDALGAGAVRRGLYCLQALLYLEALGVLWGLASQAKGFEVVKK